ncbi:MAG: peroxidase-related enzyme [Albidovulum sp.]|nr:peroxidase-related enzyme [Albidovulum sp.]MDE0531640.1 peroxidase-related enzyme [Albidovulum sp.]
MTAWIRMISDNEADDRLRAALETARTPHGTVDNVLRVHSLRPSSMEAHMALYKAVLHDRGNSLPLWLQETIGSYVSILNECDYSLANHWANAKSLIGNDERSSAAEAALKARCPHDFFEGRELALLQYAEKLTLRPGTMEKSDVEALRAQGLNDGEILEANQIIGYFNYVNRSLNGLGVSTDGDVIGYYS